MLLFKDDLRDDFRLSERSAKVVRYWGSPQESYEHETGDAKECDAYLKLTAERVMFRVKVLGLPVPDAFLTDRELLDVSFIDGRTPKLSEILDPQVRIAMAYVPLTPVGNVGNPVLARLYCAKGLQGRYFPVRILDDGLLPRMEGYSWFFAGLPDEKFDRKIDGRSWLLAASLLMKVTEEGKSEVARNLAKRFIVTGDVRGDMIVKVEMGRKWELAETHTVFKDFKWIIPKENEMSIPILKTKKFDTVDSAYEFVERMINQETVNLANFAKAGREHETQEFLGLLKNCADPSESVEGTNARQRLIRAYECDMKRHLDKIKETGNVSNVQINKLRYRIDDGFEKDRLMSYYGDVPQMFFTFARLGDSEMINLLKQRGFDINATDGTGSTALDFAIEVAEDSSVIDLLKKFGGERRIYRMESDKMWHVMSEIQYGNISDESYQFIKESFENGTSPNEVVKCEDEDFENEWNDLQEEVDLEGGQKYDDFGRAIYDSKTYRRGWRRYSTTLLLEAMFSGDRKLVELCLDHGGSLEPIVRMGYDEKLVREDFASSGGEPKVYDVELEYYPEEIRIAELLNYHNNFSGEIRKLFGK